MLEIFSPQVFGILSLITVAIGIIPYYVDIIRGNTKPQKVAMLLFAVLSAIAFLGQLTEGAQASLLFAGALLLNQLILLGLAVKYGMSDFGNKDKFALLATIVILTLWYFTQSAVVALLLTTLVNTIGKVLVTIKVYKFPNSELAYSWYALTLASVFGALAVGRWDWVLLLVPLHNAVTVGIIALTITTRRAIISKSS